MFGRVLNTPTKNTAKYLLNNYWWELESVEIKGCIGMKWVLPRLIVTLVQFGTICTILKSEKHQSRSVTFSKVAVFNLQKVTLVHGCFSRFLNCTNGTKSRNASQIFISSFYSTMVVAFDWFFKHEDIQRTFYRYCPFTANLI